MLSKYIYNEYAKVVKTLYNEENITYVNRSFQMCEFMSIYNDIYHYEFIQGHKMCCPQMLFTMGYTGS